MARKIKDELPEFLEALNNDIDEEEQRLMGKDIQLPQHSLEELIRREELQDSESYENERKAEYLQRFHREREDVRRKDESMSHAKRQRWVNAQKGILYVDPKDIPPNEQWCWAAEKVRNQPNEENMFTLLSKGWVPVTPEEYKSFKDLGHYAEKFNLKSDGLVRKGASVLMKISKELYEEEREFMDESHKKVRQSVKNLTRQMGEQHGVASLGVVVNESERTTNWNSRF